MSTKPVSTEAVAYAVSVVPSHLPDAYHFTLRVEWTGPDRWAVRHLSRCWNFRRSKWEIEPSPSNRSDAWLADHRRRRDIALAVASRLAPDLTCNGIRAEDFEDWKAARGLTAL